MSSVLPLPAWKKILFGLIVTALVLGVVELGLRLAMGPPPASTIVYNAFGPRDGWFNVSDGMVRSPFVEVDPPPPFPVAYSGQRCAVLGGSTVHGGSPDVGNDGEFPALMTQDLGFPVINLAAPGFDSFDHLAMTRELLAWPWSCLILAGGHNDFGNLYFLSRYGDTGSGLKARAMAGLEQLYLFSQLHRLVARPEWSQTRLPGVPSSTEGFVDPARLWQALRHFQANTERLLWLAKEAKVPVLVVIPAGNLLQTPTQQFCTGPDCAVDVYQQALAARQRDPVTASALLRRARDLDQIPLRAPSAALEILRSSAEKYGFPVVDAERELPQERDLQVPQRPLFRDAVHLSVSGHRAMARILEPAVSAMLEEPKQP